MNSNETLPDALLCEMERVRGVLAIYQTLGPGGAPASALMRAELAAAREALSEHDAAGMVCSLASLRGWQL